MLSTSDKIIKHKVGLLNLAEELGNVSRACQVMGCQRRSKSLPLGRSKSRPVCLIFGYVFWPLQGPEDIVRH